MLQELPIEALWDGRVLISLTSSFQPWLLNRYYRWLSLAPEGKLTDHAVLTFFLDILMAVLYPKPSDLWPSLASETCRNPEQPQPCFPSQQPLFLSQLISGHGFVTGLGIWESKEGRPWFYVHNCVFFFNALSCWVGRTGPGFSTGPASTLSDPLFFHE